MATAGSTTAQVLLLRPLKPPTFSRPSCAAPPVSSAPLSAPRTGGITNAYFPQLKLGVSIALTSAMTYGALTRLHHHLHHLLSTTTTSVTTASPTACLLTTARPTATAGSTVCGKNCSLSYTTLPKLQEFVVNDLLATLSVAAGLPPKCTAPSYAPLPASQCQVRDVPRSRSDQPR